MRCFVLKCLHCEILMTCLSLSSVSRALLLSFILYFEILDTENLERDDLLTAIIILYN